MKCSLALPVLTYLCLTASALPTRPPKAPVCIIGGGPAGLTAAARLDAKGIESIVFEKQAAVGGKCQSYYDDEGIFHPLGAAFFSNTSYPETLKVINESGVSIEEFALAGAREQFRFNITTGAIEAVPALSTQALQRVAAEVPRYIQLWNRDFAPISATNYKKGVPDSLTVSGEQWFKTNNFTVLPQLLVNPIALYGYGDIRVVPALYILQYFTPDILTGFLGQHNVYYTDFHKIWVEWLKKKGCKAKINLSHEVRCIDRSGKNPVIKYTAPKPYSNFYRWGKQECDSLIFAFPPSIANLERVGLDLTEEEHDVFSEVVTHNYYSSAVEFELPFGVSYIANSSNSSVPPPNDMEPVAVLRLSAASNVSTSWSWGKDNVYESESTAREILQTTLSKINKDPRNMTAQSEPVDSDEIKAFKKWDYFPHFGSEALRNGAYGYLNRLQGCNKSFWASGLGGMEIVEWAIRAGQDVVDTYY
ncbi:FAD/NAD(P)-binding domain-containing protein [Paraphaeosphaeria sporulosa]|uniref:FAD/NAD(P)-binding domain-containing protein n=1 Tax=Paraphaeosphaeria sporulosa TaxID=1460663 RepID=A0A177CZJ1_9PLEO|nr:FAD/NAD(P)-binding domain-containing protein [Paraphaeosphaeria sporulosa]OAG12923.1 FAD/NAD(P)-binding domain-containing protein [Paraphaeosphaeria sporulosa]